MPAMGTRQIFTEMDVIDTTGKEGKTITVDIPPVGLYARLWLSIRAEIATTDVGNENPLGLASILNDVRVFGNGVADVFQMSGAHYHYLVRNQLDLIQDPIPQSNAKEAVAPGLVNLDMVIPFTPNLRDMVGLLVGGNRRSLFQLAIRRETDANVGVLTWVQEPIIRPTLEWFTPPRDPNWRPPLNVLHQMLSESRDLTGTGQYRYQIPLGGTYAGLYLGYGIGELTSGTTAEDKWTDFSLVVNQATRLISNQTPELFDMLSGYYRTLERLPGTIIYDALGSAGLGSYDQARDWIKSQYVTQLEAVFNRTAEDTLYVVRRQFIPIDYQGGRG